MGFILVALMNTAWSDYFKKVFRLYTDASSKTLIDDSQLVDKNGKLIYSGSNQAGAEAWYAASNTLNIVTLVLWIILAVVGVAGVIYSIYLGVKLARAEDQSKRDEAKKHLITVIIAIVVTLVLVVFFNTILPLILGAVQG